jgi:membrane protease YdiL (CAAX protease family)
MMLESSLFSALLLLILASLLILPSFRMMPGLGVIPALFIIALVTWLRGEGWEAVGLTPPDSWMRTFGLSILVGSLIALTATILIEPLSERLTGSEHDLSALGTIRGNLKNTLVWIAAAWLTAATLEELIFRGFMMRELASLLGKTFAAHTINILAVSVIFGFAHWYQSKAGALSTGIISLVLGALFIWNDFRLWLLISTHGVIDTVGLLLIFLGWDQRLKGLVFPSPVTSRQNDDRAAD